MENNNYYISTDKSKLDIMAIKSLLKQSYWACYRSELAIKKSIENSLCFGGYKGNQKIGYGRVVTDYATIYWICDIIIDVKHRGHGLGKLLMKNIVETPEIENLAGILRTKDAHGLYEQYGFSKSGDRFMSKAQTADMIH